MTRFPTVLVSLAIIGSLAGCDYNAFDNYDPPRSTLRGHVVFDATPIGVRSNGVQLELWEPSYELNEKIPVHLDQDGSFSAVVFDGDYLLNLRAGNGPWVDSSDTLRIQVRGGMEVDVAVQPYYLVDSPTMSRTGSVVDADFAVREVVGGRAIEYVGLYVSNTVFVDRINMQARVETAGSELGDTGQPVSLRLELPATLQSGTLYGRIGIKSAGVDEMIFSPVQRLGS